MLDSSAGSVLNYLALSALQAAQQAQQAQATTQADLTQFQHDGAAYTAGQGVSQGQINQDMGKLKQDASNLQNLTSTFQKDTQFFWLGLLGGGSTLSADDQQSVLADAYFLFQQQSTINLAQQTGKDAGSVQQPDPPPPPSSSGGQQAAGSQLLTLTLNPLNVNLLGVQLQTSQIQVNVAAQSGQGDLLGNALGDVANLVNLPGVSNALNSVLGSVVSLANSATLNVSGVNTASGPLTTSPGATDTSVLKLHVAPVTLNLLGANVTTSPIDVTLTAHSGQGQVLGNVLTDLANLFNPPPQNLTIDQINTQLGDLLTELNQQIPNVGNSSTPTPTLSNGQFLNLTVPPINLNLLGLILQTSPIQVNATNQTGNGDLLGNITTSLLNTLGANPTNLSTLNGDLNAILGKVIGVLNASTLTLPAGAVSSLSQALQQLAAPNLVTSQSSVTAPILNLAIASPGSNTPPVDVNLLGLDITTSNIQAQLLAQTGDGQILGNLLYNVANLLNPGGSPALLGILNELGL